jgi:AcrR family transcriptional regulator
VLRAAVEVLAEQGMPGFTIEAVANRAGASKATLYRRWSSRSELLIEAMDEFASRPLAVPTTGHLRADLIELVRAAEALLRGRLFPRLMAAFIDAAEREPALQQLHAAITESRRQPVRQVLVQARLRGELPPTADLDLAIDMLAAPLFYGRFIAHRQLGDGYAETLVDHVLAALR